MKKSIIIATLSLLVAFSGFTQSNNKKGPAYKNAKASEKYDGSTSILINQNPNQFQGPEYKNKSANKYEIKVLDDMESNQSPDDMIVSTKEMLPASGDTQEVIIYQRVELKDAKGKNTKGLKGPAYKNYKPGQK